MLYTEIQNAIKEAMKSKEVDKKDVLKMVVAKAQAIAKESKCDITDSIILDGIQKELKQLNQTKDSLTGRENSELYKSTVYKIEVLNGYLPKMMTENEVRAAISYIVDTTNVELNKGALMKAVMPKLKGKADGKIISKCVDDIISRR